MTGNVFPKRLRAGGLEIEFERNLSETQARLDQAGLPSVEDTGSPLATPEARQLAQTVHTSPAATILEVTN